VFALDYISHSFRNAETILCNDSRYIHLWDEFRRVISDISETDIINSFRSSTRRTKKSISDDINSIIDSRFTALGWNRQSSIFNNPNYQNGRQWKLDFAKEEISVEVAFNHSGAISWNLIKPVLASELNHVQKAIQTSVGIIVTATDAMRLAGNFDAAVGTYEKFLNYLNPMRNMLTVPIILIGLKPPTTFIIHSVTRSVVML
jgi:hypothetical protein